MQENRLKKFEEECLRHIEESGAVLCAEDTGEHYLLSSGLHTGIFYQLARACERSSLRELLAQLMYRKMKAEGINPKEIDVFLGPAQGSLPLMYALQQILDCDHIRVIYAERNETKDMCATLHEKALKVIAEKIGHTNEEVWTWVQDVYRDEQGLKQIANRQKEKFVLARGFSLEPDERVFIIDDVATTFSTIRETIRAAHRNCAVQGWEAYITGFSVLIDRTNLERESPRMFAPGLQYAYGLRIPLVAYPPTLEDCPYCRDGVKLMHI